jgi:hypothetical protein
MILLAYAFIDELRAKTETGEKLPSFPTVVVQLVGMKQQHSNL